MQDYKDEVNYSSLNLIFSGILSFLVVNLSLKFIFRCYIILRMTDQA